MTISSLDNAESWLSIIWYAKVVAAALVVIGVVIQFGADWIAKPYEDTVKRERELQIKALEAEAQTAKSEIARANEGAATANERTADLERENLEIRQKLAGRRISKEQHDALVNILSSATATVDMDILNDDETGLFSSDILKTLTDAGWTVRNKEFPVYMSWQGLSISLSDDPVSHRLLAAFLAVGIPVSWFDQKRDFPTLWIGGKPSPF